MYSDSKHPDNHWGYSSSPFLCLLV